MKISKYIQKKLFLMIAAQLISLILLAAFLVFIKASMLYADRKELTTQMAGQFRELAAEADATAQILSDTYDDICRSKAKTFAWLVTSAADKAGLDIGELTADQAIELAKTRETELDAMLSELQILLGVDNLLLATREGTLLGGAWATDIDLSAARYNQLRTTFTSREPSTPFTVRLAEGDYRFCAMAVTYSCMAIVMQNPAEQEQLEQDARNWSKMMDGVGMGEDTVCFVVSGRDYTCLYHPDQSLIGADCIGMGLRVEDMQDGMFTVMTLWGRPMYCAFVEIGGNYLVCAETKTPLTSSELMSMLLVLVSFYVLTCTMIVYGVFIMMERENETDPDPDRFRAAKVLKGMYRDRVMEAKIPAAMCAGLAGIFVMSFYVQTLITFSQYSVQHSNELASLQRLIENNQTDSAVLSNRLDFNRLSQCKTAAYVIEHYPGKANNRGMAELSRILDVQATYLYDASGRLIANDAGQGNFSLSDDPEKQSYPFNRLLQGVDYVIQEPMLSEISGRFLQHIGCCLRDKGGNITGAVQIAVDPALRERATRSLSLEAALQEVRMGGNGFAFAVRKSDGVFVMPDRRLSGEKAADYGFGEAQLTDGFNGILTIDGRRYYAASEETGEYLLYTAVPKSELGRYRLLFSALTTVFCLLCIGVFLLLLVFVHGAEVRRLREGAGPQDALLRREMPDGTVRQSVPVDQRWGQGMFAAAKTPEQRTLLVIKGVITVVVTIIGAMLLISGRQAERNSVIMYVISGRWQRGFNIFALTAALMIVCVVEVARMLVTGLLRLASRAVSARGETICRLLDSLSQYAAAIATLYFCLAFIGVDIQTLVASAGILSLVIGLGAQKLIADIIAGLFIIFEGDLQVGDVVTINDYRGVVQEIGLRTTKVMGVSDNVRIFTNSSINNMMNMTRRWSSAAVSFTVDYSEDLERVEQIFQDALPAIRKRIPQAKSELSLTSINSFEGNGMGLMISVKCKEADSYGVSTALRREIKLLMDRNGIRFGVPSQRIIQNPESGLPAEADETPDPVGTAGV